MYNCYDLDFCISAIKENIASDPSYLQKKIREYFIDNRHCLTLVMTPKVVERHVLVILAL